MKGTAVILSSPYTRALQTAAILSKELQADIAVETELHEWPANTDYIYEDGEKAEEAYFGIYGEQRGLSGSRDWKNAQHIRKRVPAVLQKYSGYEKTAAACRGMRIQAVTGGKFPENGEIQEFEL